MKTTVKKLNNNSRYDVLSWVVFAALMAGAVAFAFWKCFYGFGGDDETFYLSVPHRFIQGDVIFRHEWNLTQISGVLMMPFVKLYTVLFGTDTIILASRMFYVVVHAAVCVLIYSRLRKYGLISMIGVVLFFLFTPYDIMTYSYNSMALDFIALSGVLMSTSSCKRRIPLMLYGVTFAAAVLCSPYMAAAYALYLVCVVLHHISAKRIKALSGDMFSFKTALWFTLGIIVTAAVFLAYVLTKISLGEVLESVKRMMSYSALSGLGFVDRLWGRKSYLRFVFDFHPGFYYGAIAYGVMLVVMIVDRNRRARRVLYLVLSCALSAYVYILLIPKLFTVYFNAMMFPLIFVTITSYILLENKPREIFTGVFALGVIYSFIAFYNSDQEFYIISVALTVSNLAGFVFLSQLIREIRGDAGEADLPALRAIAVTAAVIILAFQGSVQILTKANHCFWEPKTSKLTAVIKSGPAKHLRTTEKKCKKYTRIFKDIQGYKKRKRDNLLVVSNKSWIYFALDGMRYSTYSAWVGDDRFFSTKQLITKLSDYYKVNPDKAPKYIYMPKGSKWNEKKIISFFGTDKYSVSESKVSFKLERK